MAARTFDSGCYELAAAFLSDEPALNTEAARSTLARAIQDCIEDEIDFMRSVLERA